MSMSRIAVDRRSVAACSPEPTVNCAASATDDPISVLRFATAAMADGLGVVLATLVEIRGGAARRLGAQMAVRSDGVWRGFISGGCLEAAVAAEALACLDDGRGRVVRFGAGSPFFDIVLPCGGGVSIALHPLRGAGTLVEVLRRLDARIPAALSGDVASGSLSAPEGAVRPGASEQGFTRVYRPRLRLALHGRGVEAEAVGRLAAVCGHELVVTSGAQEFGAGLIDADTAVVLMDHDPERELPALLSALRSPAFYIGALGSRRTHAARVGRLRGFGVSEPDIARIRGPVGIFGPARDATSLALSVLAQIAEIRSAQEDG